MKKQPSPTSLAVFSTPQLREVSIYKKSHDVATGMSLHARADSLGKGSALVARVTRDSIAAKSTQLFAGDSIVAINGVAVMDYKHASELLRSAEGVVQLVITTAAALPDGWTSHVDKSGETYYAHAELRLKTFSHPAAVVADARREVTIHKTAADTALGLSLAEPDGDVEGVLISHVTRDGIAARWLKAGDTVLAVNDVDVTHYQDASRLLRAAVGDVRLRICTAAVALPEGWASHIDKNGETCYTHEQHRLMTFSHPAAVSVESACPSSPRKSPRNADPVARWHRTYHTVSLLNSLNGDTERENMTQASLSPSRARGMLQHERV